MLIAAVDVSCRQAKAGQFTLIVTNQVQLKAVEPPHTAFSDSGNILKNLIAFNAFIVANGDFGTLHEGDAGRFAETDGVEKKHHGNEYPVLNLHKTVI
jgi:hypothetical protein